MPNGKNFLTGQNLLKNSRWALSSLFFASASLALIELAIPSIFGDLHWSDSHC